MDVLICVALLLIGWAAFVFSKYNPDRRIASDKVHPRPNRALHRWYR